MDSRHILMFVYIILISRQAYSHIINATTCSCNVLGKSKGSCVVQEDYDPKSSIYYPSRVGDFDANIVKLSTNKVFLDLMWAGPSGGSLNSVTGFIIELKLVNRSSQTVLIPVRTTPERDANNQVNWSMRCEFEASAYERNNDLVATVYPTPIPTSNRRSQSESISIYVNRKMAEENAVDWEPSLIFKSRSLDANTFDVKFNVPKALQTLVPAFQINIEVASNKPIRYFPKTIRSNEGIITFKSDYIWRDHALKCYRIMVTKVCGGCEGGKTHCKDYTGDCTIPNPIKLWKRWNGSNCPRWFQEVTVNPTVTSDPEQPRENNCVYVFVVVPVVVIITLALAVFLFWKFLKGWKLPCHRCIEDIPGPDPGSPNKLKSVLLIYSDDNFPHKKVIQAYATFLQAKCMCKVFFDEWDMLEMSKDILSWHLEKLDSVDIVIMIHSVGSWLKAAGKESSEMNRLPKGDPFLMMLPIIRNYMAQGKDDRFIMMHFSYTHPTFVINDLPVVNKFEIPKHLEDLVLHIHHSQSYPYNNITSMKNINVQNYHLVKEGNHLKRAIENMEVYMKQNPDCFEVPDQNYNIIPYGKTYDLNTCSDDDYDGPSLIGPNSDVESNGDENSIHIAKGNNRAILNHEAIDMESMIAPNSDIDSDYEASFLDSGIAESIQDDFARNNAGDLDRPISLISEVSLIPPEFDSDSDSEFDSDSSSENNDHDRFSDFGNNHGNRCSI